MTTTTPAMTHRLTSEALTILNGARRRTAVAINTTRVDAVVPTIPFIVLELIQVPPELSSSPGIVSWTDARTECGLTHDVTEALAIEFSAAFTKLVSHEDTSFGLLLTRSVALATKWGTTKLPLVDTGHLMAALIGFSETENEPVFSAIERLLRKVKKSRGEVIRILQDHFGMQPRTT